MAKRSKTQKKISPSELKQLNITGTALGELFGVSSRWIRELKKYGLPQNPDKTYNIYLACRWMHEFYKKLLKKKEGGSLQEERKRLVSLQADLAEIELQIKKRQLLSIDEVQKEVSIAIREFKNELTGLSRRLASDLAGESDPAKVRLTLQREIIEVLNNVSEKLEKISDSAIDFEDIKGTKG